MDYKQKILTLHQIAQIVTDCHLKILQLSLSSSESDCPFKELQQPSDDVLKGLKNLLSVINQSILDVYDEHF